MDQPTNIQNTQEVEGVEIIATVDAPSMKPKTSTRGRRSGNIKTAFSNVPSEPTDLEEFAEKYNVSTSVLRQVKRFDKTNLPGKVMIKMNKVAKKRLIWRETSESDNAPTSNTETD